MNAIILSIGNELTLGETVDTNSAWLARRLAEIGISTTAHVTVADEREAIRRALGEACGRAEVVLVSGGLGPTADDLTRFALADLLGTELVRDEASVGQIAAFFRIRGRPMPEANVVQAMIPAGAVAIENTCGTAPGIRTRHGHTDIFIMPGVPREMQVMYERDVLPALRPKSGGAVIGRRILWCYGAGESDIGMQIADLMQRGRNPTVGTTAQQTIIGVRIHAHGHSPEQTDGLLDADAAEVRRRLGDLVFGQDDDTLADVVGRLLIDRKRTVATAESCTGGLIAKHLTDVPGSSTYFRQGYVTYANEAKVELLGVPQDLIAAHGAVSPEVAGAMATGCRQRAGTDYALSVTGIAGPTGGTPDKPVGLVYIGLADETGCDVTEHRLGDCLTREEVRDRTMKVALNRLRLLLMKT
jgi:nicotinamide-nucleotide amidase